MSPAATLGLYAGALALVFSAALGVGRAVGPVGTAATPAHSTGEPSTAEHSTAEPGSVHGD